MASVERNVESSRATTGADWPFQTALFQALPVPAALIDPAGQIAALNRAWGTTAPSPWHGPSFSVGDNYFQRAASLSNPLDGHDHFQGLRAVLAGDMESFAFVYPAGGPPQFHFSATPVLENQARGLLLLVQPLPEAERPRLEAKVREAQKLDSLGALAGGIAHDFNNLLTAILGYASLVRMELPADAPARDYIHQVEKAARRAADLTQQMLAFAGQGKFSLQPVYLSRLIREMEPLPVAGQATLRLALAEDLPVIGADPMQIRQVVTSLVANAVEALEDRAGTVTLRTGLIPLENPEANSHPSAADPAPGPYVFLEVQDTGCGMVPEVLARIFEPFFTTKFTGRGLGMAAVLGIIRGHGGRIKVESTPGAGSTIQVHFPTPGGKLAIRP